MHWINHYPLDNSIGFASVYPLMIVIYPVDSVIHRLNNRGLTCRFDQAVMLEGEIKCLSFDWGLKGYKEFNTKYSQKKSIYLSIHR